MVVTSLGKTKTLESIEEEQSARERYYSNKDEENPKSGFDPVLVYGLAGISSVFVILGIIACVGVAVTVSSKKRRKNQVHVAPEGKRVSGPTDPKFTCMRADSPAKILVAERRSHRNIQ